MIVLGMWALLSIVAHIPSFPASKFKLLVDLGLIPDWSFFAPNPPKGDFVILYRDKLYDENLTNWVEVRKPLKNEKISWIWNPNKRINKSIFDIISQLLSVWNELRKMEASDFDKTQNLIYSMPYLILLNYVFNMINNPLSMERQFAILSSSGSKHEIVFTSNFHKF